MKPNLFFTTLLIFLLGANVEAQLLDELKKRAEKKGLETREVSFDSSNNAKNRTTSFDEELVINSAKDFFTTDVVMKLYYETEVVIHTQYFDADVIAMRTEFPDQSKKPMFHDNVGYTYAYNDGEGVYEKMKLLSSGMTGFMMAGIIPQSYKLPPQPYLEAFKALEEKEIALNFMILELAFIYKPSHFEDDLYYIPSTTTCNGSDDCIKYTYNDPEYPESYILFDDKDRLIELYINTTKPEVKEEDHPTGKFVYSYNSTNVSLPDALELKSNPFGDLIDLNKGLEVWKHNKKDKQKN